jgi:predicted dehydrogenase
MRIAILGQSQTHGYQQALSGFPEIEIVGEGAGQPLDAMIVFAPVEQRTNHIKRLTTLTKHILCEIPFSPTKTDAEAVIQLCQTQGVKLYPTFRFRHLPVFKSLKSMIAQNKLGQPLSVKLQYRMLRQDSGSGAALLLTDMMQVIDLLRWLLGMDITEQHAETIENGVILSVALVNGTYATLDVSLSLPPTYPAPEALELEIIGTGGWARIDAFRQVIGSYSLQGAHQANWGSDPFKELLRAYMGAVKNDQPMATAHDALRAQEIAQTVFETPETR